MIRRLAALLAVALLASCGGEERGTATLWVTRDRGAQVLVTAEVAAGQSAMQALDREADLDTRYGGRYVQVVEGLEGSLSKRRDWFWFVNGYEADRSAAEYRLRAGDVVWFDYRDWDKRRSQPVVVGAFPEPFLHGVGKRRPAVVVYGAGLRAEAVRFAELLRGRTVACCSTVPPADANVLALTSAPRPGVQLFVGEYRGKAGPGEAVRFELTAAPDELQQVVEHARRRYEWRRPQS